MFGIAFYLYWTQYGMPDSETTQTTLRCPDEMVASLDRTVSSGKAPSRAELEAAAVERAMRRLAAEEENRTLRAEGAADDLDDLLAWTVIHASVED
jgi:Arc/MetJ-type ribon-helix-helix transcriptional regulator